MEKNERKKLFWQTYLIGAALAAAVLGAVAAFGGRGTAAFALGGGAGLAVALAAHRFGTLLAEQAARRPQMPLRLLGPAPMNIAMLGGKYRYKLTIKCRNDAAFRALLRETLDAYAKEKLPQKASVVLDFNSDGDL